ncbi:hypothetical protein [Streptacidiphilus melanogenes]|uniref:hypothetical protein n=1 Tax=Streptacidiphilus melanogenes TaxID=411235 RepID=UPI0005A94B9A|nr:hypothetical protein [Streptacidiphilus melanogenes]
MSDSAAMLCRDCRFVLDLGYFWNTQEPREIFTGGGPARGDQDIDGALWRFLADHVYHRVRLLGEQSEDWSVIDVDYTRIGTQYPATVTPAEYAEGWRGRALAAQPRPLCDTVRALIRSSETEVSGPGVTISQQQEAAVESLYEELPCAESPAREVDRAELGVRLAAVERSVALVRRVSESLAGHPLEILLRESSAVIAEALEQDRPGLLTDWNGLASPALFDAERALILLKDTLGGYAG